MKKGILYLFFFVLIATKVQAQNIALNYQNLPLNEVLIDLNQRYDAQISINSSISENCQITLSGQYDNMLQAMKALAKECNLEVTQVGNVYTFQQKKPTTATKTAKKPPLHLFQGTVIDGLTGEPLPFSRVETGSTILLADENGKFSFKSEKSSETILFRHLGYGILDTSLHHQSQLQIQLNPKSFGLSTIIVDNKPTSSPSPIHLPTIGQSAGHIKLNDIATQLIPGNDNNMIFNHLRLYPGIMAAGESISDFITWGSYKGQGQIIYDGISLFSGSGINDDIGRVNPLMIKNIEVYKGGYNVDKGDRIGGIMLIDSKNGDRKKISGNISLNNQVAGGRISIPLFNHSSTLQIAGRKSYYELLDFKPQVTRRANRIVPQYQYGDLNLKFTTVFKNKDLLEVSSILSKDTYKESFNRKQTFEYQSNLSMLSSQIGGSIQYTHQGKKGGNTKLQLAQSQYHLERTSFFQFKDIINPNSDKSEIDKWDNQIEEYSARIIHNFASARKQNIQLSAAYIHNQSKFKLDSADNELKDFDQKLDRLSFYFKDNIQFAPIFNVQVGLKADLPLSTQKVYLQPRVEGQLKLSKKLKLNFGWGIYNQFIGQPLVLDEFGNQTEIWQIFDGKALKPLQSMHNVVGLAYHTKRWEIGLEGYYKTISNLSRFVAETDSITATSFQGDAIAKGVDFFLKFRFSEHEMWTSYSLGEIEEQFSGKDGETITQLAPHSQLHELKVATAFNFSPFHLTATYVYGSGFPNSLKKDSDILSPYHRMDVAFQYRFKVKKTNFQTGFSILNVFNYKNTRLGQFTRFPDGSIQPTLGIPFTPNIYLNLSF